MDDSNRLERPREISLSDDGVREILGYLNFSGGKRDARFLGRLNELWAALPADAPAAALRQQLEQSVEQVRGSTGAFTDVTQVSRVIELTLAHCLPRYREHHADLLFHLEPVDFEAPFLLGCMFEAVLAQGEPWEETERIVSGAIDQLNDFVGYRPVAVLENGRRMEVYPHERFRAVPIYIAEVGVARGRYYDLLTRTIEFLQETPREILEESYFSLERLDELCLDVRAHDHLHPVNKRTNYLFGEWDPHLIDTKGDYRRFVIRKTLLDALCEWVEQPASGVPLEERLFDSAAALCGTMLMASSISGSGPGTHDSTVSLTSLLPIVARRRDAFYQKLMERLSGARARRLEQERERTQQPFGHIRQHLNMQLAGLGARQIQHRALAHLFARMGQAEASREQALAIPACSIRMECDLLRETALISRLLDNGKLAEAAQRTFALPDVIRRGIECGAFADPWNMLGFQGNFPLFHSREDAIPDNRLETLVELMSETFQAYSRLMAEAAAAGQADLAETTSRHFRDLADWWDQFGGQTVSDLPPLSGEETWESSRHVSRALSDWQAAGESAGDLTFWRQHVDRFQSARSYALVIDALLRKQDYVSSLGLICQWLSVLDEFGCEAGRFSIYEMLLRWTQLVSDPERLSLSPTERVGHLIQFLQRVETNSGEHWMVPELEDVTRQLEEGDFDPLWEYDELEEEEHDEENIYGAAYEGFVFRDSASDGNWGDTLDDETPLGGETEFEEISRNIESRLKFLNAVGQVWQTASALLVRSLPELPAEERPPLERTIREWQAQAREWEADLWNLMTSVNSYTVPEPSGDHDANVEFDIQLQVKLHLLQQIVSALLSMRNAMRMLQGALPPDSTAPLPGTERDLARLYADILRRDAESCRQQLPAILQILQEHPLLYVPLEHGGDPEQLLRAQAMQSVMRFLLRELPRLGLLKETWHVLRTAFEMERKWRPDRPAVTEFDRLFDVALRNSVRTLLESARNWEGIDPEDVVGFLDDLLTFYEDLWTQHADTMRLSSVDGLRGEVQWRELKEFIETYGQDLFHATQLQLGNVRTILHRGVGWYFNYLDQEVDPLHPIRLVEDLRSGKLDWGDAVRCVETIYSMIVDKFDRFLEYNTTTTQSDYGEKFYSLLDFLNVEARYDRDAWLMMPQIITHEILCRLGWTEAAYIWEDGFRDGTAATAAQHLQQLERLERLHGMQLPTIADHLRQRFVKPMLVSRMLARIRPAIQELRADGSSAVFQTLYHEIQVYLEESWGSGIDVPGWIRQLQHEVDLVLHPDLGGRPGPEVELRLPSSALSRSDYQQQLRTWQVRPGEAPKTRSPGNRSPKGPRRPPQGGGTKRRKDE